MTENTNNNSEKIGDSDLNSEKIAQHDFKSEKIVEHGFQNEQIVKKDSNNVKIIKNIFDKMDPKFPLIAEGRKLNTKQFLEASRSLLQIYDLLGAAFYIVKKDMLGNIEKLTKTYKKNGSKYTYLEDLIVAEKSDPKLHSIEALLWLKRALEFTSSFIGSLVKEWRSGKKSDTLFHIVSDSYDLILKQYHNWFIQSLFKVVLRAFPSRIELIRLLSCNSNQNADVTELEAVLMGSAETYTKEVDLNLDFINKIYSEHELEKSYASLKSR